MKKKEDDECQLYLKSILNTNESKYVSYCTQIDILNKLLLPDVKIQFHLGTLCTITIF